MADFLMGLCGAWYILWFAIWALVAIWVYRDAEGRGTSGLLWSIVVILLAVIGLVIYLVVRPKQKLAPAGHDPPRPGGGPSTGHPPPPGQ